MMGESTTQTTGGWEIKDGESQRGWPNWGKNVSGGGNLPLRKVGRKHQRNIGHCARIAASTGQKAKGLRYKGSGLAPRPI